jgi:phospholipid/cholesterol/gamma-HCH transport system substrate-binding protein
VAIGSEGLIGDRLLIITQGSADSPEVKEGQKLESMEPLETDAIMASLMVTAGNAEIISQQLAEIVTYINSGQGTLGRLIQDTIIAENIDQIVVNLKTSSKGLDENMEAAKHNFLLKGYFNKKEAAAAKQADDSIKAVNKQKKTDKKDLKDEENQK